MSHSPFFNDCAARIAACASVAPIDAILPCGDGAYGLQYLALQTKGVKVSVLAEDMQARNLPLPEQAGQRRLPRLRATVDRLRQGQHLLVNILTVSAHTGSAASPSTQLRNSPYSRFSVRPATSCCTAQQTGTSATKTILVPTFVGGMSARAALDPAQVNQLAPAEDPATRSQVTSS